MELMLLLLSHIAGSSFQSPLRAQTRRRSRDSHRTRNSAAPLIVDAPVVEPRVSLPLWCSLTPRRGDTSFPSSHDAHCDRDLHHGCYDRHRSCWHCSDMVPTSPRLGIGGVMVALAWRSVCGVLYTEFGLL